MQFFTRYTFSSIHQDVAPDKRPPTMHKNIVNMETFLTDRGLSAKVSKGTTTGIEIPDLGTAEDVFIIGHENIGKRLFI